MDLEAAMHALKRLPFEDLGYARIDNHRCMRTGVPEVIYCAGAKRIMFLLMTTFSGRRGHYLLFQIQGPRVKKAQKVT